MTSGVHGAAGQATVDEVVRRVVEIAHPLRIVIFGSAVRQEAGPDSDIDILVVVPGPVHRRRLAQEIHLSFFGLGVPVDVIVATPEDLERHRGKAGTILDAALRDGREIYAA